MALLKVFVRERVYAHLHAMARLSALLGCQDLIAGFLVCVWKTRIFSLCNLVKMMEAYPARKASGCSRRGVCPDIPRKWRISSGQILVERPQ